MIRRLAIGLLLLSLLTVLGCQADLPKGAIAQVGQAFVSQDQFDRLKAAHEAVGRAPDKDKQPDRYRMFERGLVEYLVTLEVLRQKSSSFGFTVTEQDVLAKLEQIRRMFQSDEEKLQEALDKKNITLEQLTQSIRESLWLEGMKTAVTEGVTVSEDEAKAYYEDHKTEYVEQESRGVRHILISPFAISGGGTATSTATQADWDAAKTEAEKVRSEIQNGADFASEAEKYSDDEPTKDSGGELVGGVIRGQTVPAFEEAVFSLQKGELSLPIKTPYGYHLIEVTDITPEKQLSYDQVKESIKSSLLSQKQSETWESWLAKKKAELGVVYRKGFEPSSAASALIEGSTTGTSGE